MQLFTLQAVLATSLLTSMASAKTIRIDVGQTGLSFTPDSVTAAKGDVLEYHFHAPLPHSVTMGDFSTPCNPAKTGGFYSGVVQTASGENTNVFSVTVNSTDPIFFYCTVPGHCPAGMSGVVNPSSAQTLATYQKNSQSANVVAPPAAFGGTLGPASASTSSTSTSAGATASPSPTNGGGGGAYGGFGGGSTGGNSGSAAVGVSFVHFVGVLGAMVGVAVLMA
ncbi:hypothetical protein B0H66DRAFT_395551 [Apodospora peruviana]|uniref:Blue (type 1) copper domain-containing protein n=1 Tax=Apodospora peruviana TaxID=516989 RepID=A0AAE0LZ34_9PEZI|nr:hypothetical protein B0H66DRAFT_395551 [Apodospora peruviana]